MEGEEEFVQMATRLVSGSAVNRVPSTVSCKTVVTRILIGHVRLLGEWILIRVLSECLWTHLAPIQPTKAVSNGTVLTGLPMLGVATMILDPVDARFPSAMPECSSVSSGIVLLLVLVPSSSTVGLTRLP